MSKKKSSKSKKDIEYGCKKITPRTSNQSKYLKSIKKDTITFGIGPAGTGKTILSIDYAINQIIKERYKKIIITRPIVEAGEKLGFLPGDIQEKVDPYIRPMIDYIEDIIGPKWKSWYNEHVEVAPLAFMRGRTFNDCILIFDESQNSTREQMKMFLTRIGENSKAILTADPTQIDLNKNGWQSYNDDNSNGVNLK